MDTKILESKVQEKTAAERQQEAERVAAWIAQREQKEKEYCLLSLEEAVSSILLIAMNTKEYPDHGEARAEIALIALCAYNAQYATDRR